MSLDLDFVGYHRVISSPYNNIKKKNGIYSQNNVHTLNYLAEFNEAVNTNESFYEKIFIKFAKANEKKLKGKHSPVSIDKSKSNTGKSATKSKKNKNRVSSLPKEIETKVVQDKIDKEGVTIKEFDYCNFPRIKDVPKLPNIPLPVQQTSPILKKVKTLHSNAQNDKTQQIQTQNPDDPSKLKSSKRDEVVKFDVISKLPKLTGNLKKLRTSSVFNNAHSKRIQSAKEESNNPTNRQVQPKGGKKSSKFFDFSNLIIKHIDQDAQVDIDSKNNPLKLKKKKTIKLLEGSSKRESSIAHYKEETSHVVEEQLINDIETFTKTKKKKNFLLCCFK